MKVEGDDPPSQMVYQKSLQSETSFWDSERNFNIIRMIIQEIEIGPDMINVDQYGICFLQSFWI